MILQYFVCHNTHIYDFWESVRLLVATLSVSENVTLCVENCFVLGQRPREVPPTITRVFQQIVALSLVGPLVTHNMRL